MAEPEETREVDLPDLGNALHRAALQELPADRVHDDVELVETHISWVLLVGDLAWKIKKPVDLGFVDFSTRQGRLHYCQEELRLNRRLAPQLYLDVVPITLNAGQPRIGKTGVCIDFAVKMRRFDQDQLLSRLADRGELTSCHIAELAGVVAEFHQAIDVAAVESPFGSAQDIRSAVNENFDYLRNHLVGGDRRRILDDVIDHTQDQWNRSRTICEERRRGGFVRECHGDMHLGNIVLWRNRVTVFDAIEFNEHFRWIDVMNEVAFVVMDLERRGQSTLAYEFLNRYCELTGDYAGAALMPFYVAYRALVRAKVKLIRAEQETAGNQAAAIREVEQKKLDRLLHVADWYTRPRRPYLTITHGLSGSGKTTLSGWLLGPLRAIRIRSDVERRRESAGASHPGRYSPDARDAVYNRMRSLAARLLDSGQSVILDATFLNRRHRASFEALASQSGAGFTILSLKVAPDVLRTRVRRRAETGLDASDADQAVLEKQLEEQQPLTHSELAASIEVNDAVDRDELLERIRQRSGDLPHAAWTGES